jgi:hypothetical protein
MATNWVGQQITFATEIDPDSHYSAYTIIKARPHDTIAKLAARWGHPEWKQQILLLNRGRDLLPHPHRKRGQKVGRVPVLRNVNQQLRAGAGVRVPGVMRKGLSFNVNAGDNPPKITGGYAKFDVVDVQGRVGINRFLGYDPLSIDIPIQFENFADQVGSLIEDNIAALERMAGRGDYPGAAYGPPAVIRVSVMTDGNPPKVVPLIPAQYQYSDQHQNAPLYRITGIAWDDGAIRNAAGFRIRQTATVTVTQYTPLQFVQRSVTQRTRQKARHPKTQA